MTPRRLSMRRLPMRRPAWTGAGSGVGAGADSSGLLYKVGAAAMVAGGVFVLARGLLGGAVFAALTGLLSLMGAPDDRAFLPPGEPGAGADIVYVLGVLVVGCGAWMFCLRLLLELLGLAPGSALIGRLGPWLQIGLGLVAAGLLVQVSAAMPETLIEDFAGFGESGVPFGAIATAGSLVVFCGLVIFLFAGLALLAVFLDWTRRVGWGRLGMGWANHLGLGLAALAVIIGAFWSWSDPVYFMAAAGAGILLVGVVPHVLAGRGP